MSICECVKKDPWNNCCRLAVAEKSITLMRTNLIEIATRTERSESIVFRAIHKLANDGLAIDENFKNCG